MNNLIQLNRSERIGKCFSAAIKYANLVSFEMVTGEEKKAQYKANAVSWKKFSARKESIAELEGLVADILARPAMTLTEALEKYEALVKAVDPANVSYTHYLRCLLVEHHLEASAIGYVSKEAIVLALQCPKAEIVGFGHIEESYHTDTGRFMEIVLYPYLKCIYALSHIYPHTLFV
jgi:hypothetical protein